jgi:predicted transcriptional regulator
MASAAKAAVRKIRWTSRPSFGDEDGVFQPGVYQRQRVGRHIGTLAPLRTDQQIRACANRDIAGDFI